MPYWQTFKRIFDRHCLSLSQTGNAEQNPNHNDRQHKGD
jgi:hypothetical protein